METPPILQQQQTTYHNQNQSLITPSSEILQCLTTFADTVDSLPPSLARALSDLKELDAVLSGTLRNITTKLQVLLKAMYTPPPGSKSEDGSEQTIITPLERLRLLREITDEARVFRLGGDDKIRVATLTCETLATHTSHLSTLSTLLLTYLPSHLLPTLPAPSAPHGYPSSHSPSSALARRQLFDYPTTSHPSQGGTGRMMSARQMAVAQASGSEWPIPGTSGSSRGMLSGGVAGGLAGSGSGLGGGSKSSKRSLLPSLGNLYDEREYSMSGNHSGREGGKDKDRDRDRDHHRDPERKKHPNQYTKKKLHPSGSASGSGTGTGGGGGGGGGKDRDRERDYHHSSTSHPMGMSAIDSVHVKKHRGGQLAGSGAGDSEMSEKETGGRGYPGMATAEEYAAATGAGGSGSGRTGKRKVEELGVEERGGRKGAPFLLLISPKRIRH